ncbi:MAG: GNAT family N-acetyltransferase [Anaerolineales bacterium]|nr:GNAT family N-acetyltransferase [Anaerolineales bacterium]
MLEIYSSRLRLIALSLTQLQAFLDGPKNLEAGLGFPLSNSIANDTVNRAIGIKISKMARVNPELYPWFTYWLLRLQSPPLGVGMAGFKGNPDAAGEVEIGYGIDPAYQNQGYMTEAVRRLAAWAFVDPRCQTITAKGVLNTNLASVRVLQKLGMEAYREGVAESDWRITRQAAATLISSERETWR